MMQSLILFFLIATGFLAGKLGVLKPDTTKALSRFLIDFTLPAIIIISMQRPFNAELRNQSLRILALSTLVYAASFPLAYAFTLLYRKASPAELGVHRFAMCFSNVAFMGFPVGEAILGKESLFIISIYNIPFQILAFSVGTMMIVGRTGPKARGKEGLGLALKKFLNPAIVSALIGFVLFLASVSIPEPLYSGLELLGSMTTPLAMVVIGAVLSQSKLRGVLTNPRLWLTTGYRLALFPVLVFGLAKALRLSGLELAVPVLVAAMPVAANTTILAGVYGGDELTASGLVFVSTSLSLVSITILATLFH